MAARGPEGANFAPMPFAGFPPEALSFYAGQPGIEAMQEFYNHRMH